VALSLRSHITPFQSVIWDWNGTLLNDSKIGSAAEAELFKRYGIPAQTHEERLKNFCMPIEKYYEKLGFDFTRVNYTKISDEWLSIYESLVQEAPLFEGIWDLLDELRAAGKRQFVLSAAPEDHLHQMLNKHSISHFFEAIYGLPNSHADSKIHRGKELMCDLQIEPSSTILIGDTVHDFEVGQALGVQVLLIADGHHSVEALRKVHHNVMPTRYSA
jgi:phosphoglycolate phosphatase